MTHDAPHSAQGMRALLRNLDSRSRDVVARTLGVLGCRDLLCLDEGDGAEDHLRSGTVDLLVVDTDGDVEAACALVRDMRRGIRAENAFAITVLMTSLAQTEHLSHLLDCGADAILEKPVDPVKVAERITALTRKRRCFVVSESYVGPDRRIRGRPDSSPAARIAVPNPLRETTLSGMSRDQLRDLIQMTWEALDRKRTASRAV
ncbi:response regulator [Magnetospirillum sp. 15-1]|uniref:response regulator n=1 Tax=Magnetospirillum sp. 15-1 TaxID=1979370 RepID=UPI001145061F|nr:response regulator [Magnetospirillum sp. 15-1]